MLVSANKLELIADNYETKGNMEIIRVGNKAYFKHKNDIVGPFNDREYGPVQMPYLWIAGELGFVILTPNGLVNIPFDSGYSLASGFVQILRSMIHSIVEVIAEEYGVKQFGQLCEDWHKERPPYIKLEFIDTCHNNAYTVNFNIGSGNETLLGVYNTEKKIWTIKVE